MVDDKVDETSTAAFERSTLADERVPRVGAALRSPINPIAYLDKLNPRQILVLDTWRRIHGRLETTPSPHLDSYTILFEVSAELSKKPSIFDLLLRFEKDEKRALEREMLFVRLLEVDFVNERLKSATDLNQKLSLKRTIKSLELLKSFPHAIDDASNLVASAIDEDKGNAFAYYILGDLARNASYAAFLYLSAFGIAPEVTIDLAHSLLYNRNNKHNYFKITLPLVFHTDGGKRVFISRKETGTMPTIDDRAEIPKRRIVDLDLAEVASLASEAWGDAAQNALKKGHPIVGEQNGRLVRLYPDGREDDLGPATPLQGKDFAPR